MARNAKLNTTESMNESQMIAHLESGYQTGLRNTQKVLKKQEKIKVSIPKHYQSVLGTALPLSINGVRRVIPVDGSVHELEKPYVDLLHNSLNTIQAQDVRDTLMKQIQDAGFGMYE